MPPKQKIDVSQISDFESAVNALIANKVDTTDSRNLTFSGKVIIGNLKLGSIANVTNLSWKGITILITAGENLVSGNPVYMGADGKCYIAKATVSTMPCIGICLATIAANSTGVILLFGFYRNDTLALTVGSRVWVSASGTLTSTAPAVATNEAQCLGVAVTSKIVYLSATLTTITIK